MEKKKQMIYLRFEAINQTLPSGYNKKLGEQQTAFIEKVLMEGTGIT
jgi:hypothetical protein